MKVVGHDNYCTWYLGNCPECDLPLIVAQPYRADCACAWHVDDEDGSWCDECPRCGGGLPEPALALAAGVGVSPAPALAASALVDLNGILAETGEPATCLEELERAGITLEAA